MDDTPLNLFRMMPDIRPKRSNMIGPGVKNTRPNFRSKNNDPEYRRNKIRYEMVGGHIKRLGR